MENKKILSFAAFALLVILGAWILLRQGNDNKVELQSDIQSEDAIGDASSIKLASSSSGVYMPKEIRVKLGSKVRIEGDLETLVGGMDTVIIDGYGIRKTIAPSDNIIEFVADKKGTFKMYCANGMGNGKLIVD